ncbi:tetratricopeptide repeat protein [Streptomyces sp. NPDC047072]|uniref:tetratricopeptide repeat protein n=1 Tax=Streptomyces sp. NPDC047072 TaxID=3154809 RepID=UPI00340D679B
MAVSAEDSARLLQGIPDPPGRFVNRAEPLERLSEAVARAHAGGPRRPVVVHGLPGCGKSALAARFAREWQATRDQPAVWVPAHLPPGADADTVLLRLADRLGPPSAQLGEALLTREEPSRQLLRAACQVQLLHTAPALLVLDDLPEGDRGSAALAAVGALCRGTDTVVVVTSGSRRTGAAVPVPHLTDAEAQDFLGPRTEARAREALVEAADGLPLLLGIAAGLARDSDRPDLTGSLDPAGLVGSAVERLSPLAAELLAALAAWPTGRMPETALPVAVAAPAGQGATAVQELRRSGLVHGAGPGLLCLSPVLGRSQLLPSSLGAPSVHVLEQRIVSAAARGTLPVEQGLEEYVALAARGLARGGPADAGGPALGAPAIHAEWAIFVPRLAHYLSLSVRPAALLTLKQAGAEPAVSLHLAVAARNAGHLQEAHLALSRLGTPAALVEVARTEHDMGRLDDALSTLGGLSDEGTGALATWTRRTRAAVLADTGRTEAAKDAFQLAAEGSKRQVRDSPRLCWHRLHQLRLAMVTSRGTAYTQSELDQLRERFDALGDVRGVAWTTTEMARYWLLTAHSRPMQTPEGALAGGRVFATEALDRHVRNGDPRGRAWASLTLGLVEAESGRHTEATKHLNDSVEMFRALPDLVGLGWSLHHLALTAGYTRRDTDRAVTLLAEASGCFTKAGNLLGAAWTGLEQSLLDAHFVGTTAPSKYLDRAQARFTFPAGSTWVGIARAVLARNEELRQALVRQLAGVYPSSLLDQVHGDLDSRTPPLPRAARYTAPGSSSALPAGPVGASRAAASHVRLVLLDEAPATDGTARIGLRVEPGPEHPWADPEAVPPWLTVRALALTRADLRPEHTVMIKPSLRPEDGTEFRFTPRRPGRHRLRFTIEHHSTGVVLQQVETAIDVSDADPGRHRASPEPGRLRPVAPGAPALSLPRRGN